MAKRRVNKTAVVTEALRKDPDASPNELAAKITKAGIKMTPGYVSTIKSSLKRKGARPKPKATRTTASGATISVEALSDCVAACNKHGIETVAEAVELIGEIRTG